MNELGPGTASAAPPIFQPTATPPRPATASHLLRAPLLAPPWTAGIGSPTEKKPKTNHSNRKGSPRPPASSLAATAGQRGKGGEAHLQHTTSDSEPPLPPLPLPRHHGRPRGRRRHHHHQEEGASIQKLQRQSLPLPRLHGRPNGRERRSSPETNQKGGRETGHPPRQIGRAHV